MGSLTPFPFEGGGGAGGGLEGTAGGGPAAPLPAAGGGTDDGDHSTCVLVHNVSHTDMLVDLALDAAQGARYDFHARAGDAWAHRGCVLARPKFSSFDGISQRLLRAIDRLSDKHPVVVARDSDVYTDVPCGFDLSAAPVELDTWTHLHLRHFANAEVQAEMARTGKPRAAAVYFPLIAVLLPKWLRLVSERYPRSRKVVYLVAGCGAPRNASHPDEANSTLRAAQAMRRLLDVAYGHLVSFEIVDSGRGVFDYGANVRFVSDVLRPRLDDHRRELAHAFGDTWAARMHVTLSLCDGPPARMAALSAGLRWYRPSTLHMWQLKAFWHEGSLREEVVHLQSYSQAEGTPPVLAATHPDAAVRALAAETVLFRDNFVESLQRSGGGEQGGREEEISTFWLRKTRKPVLAVLMVAGKEGCEGKGGRAGGGSGDSHPKFYRGLNLEVSMPTGSLCSERNVIGTALAADPTLRRQDLLMVAVLSLNLQAHLPQSSPPACNDGGTGAHTPPVIASAPASPAVRSARPPRRPREVVARRLNLSGSSGELDCDKASLMSQNSSAVDLDALLETSRAGRGGGAGPNAGRWEKALNPIAPCGACSEWIRKIMESNPDFKVVTFTDASCQQVFVKTLPM